MAGKCSGIHKDLHAEKLRCSKHSCVLSSLLGLWISFEYIFETFVVVVVVGLKFDLRYMLSTP